MDLLDNIAATSKEQTTGGAGAAASAKPSAAASADDHRIITVDDIVAADDDALPDGLHSAAPAEAPAVATSSAEVEHPLVGAENDGSGSRYIKLRQLGSGAYGEAWLCRERNPPPGASANPNSPSNFVVAKLMNLPQMSAKEQLYARSEIECLSLVNHSNIIKFITSQCTTKHLIIVMEFADAGDLRRHIKSRNQSRQFLTESEAMLLFLQVVMALEHIHSRCMLHRDLKTANVLISSNGLIKLADFGFSRRYEDTVSHAVASTFCGTPYYLAPELWNNNKYSSRAEVWSLGVLLYELFALERPFFNNSVRGLMEQICNGRYAQLPSMYSTAAQNLVATLLSLDANHRPTCLEIMKIPYVNHHFNTLIQLVKENPHITEEAKKRWHDEAMTLSAKIASSSVPHPGPSGAPADAKGGEGAHEAACYAAGVHKLAAATRNWAPKYLVLEPKTLYLCDPIQVAGGAPPVLTALADVQNMLQNVIKQAKRALPIENLQSITKIPESISKRPYVFAVHTRDTKCTWIQAADEAQQHAWVLLIQRAMGVL